MCGISGVFAPKEKISFELLKIMALTMTHRGPDYTGYYLGVKHNVGLCHNRLSILDLSRAGHQPMSSSDESKHIVFNGEIYNFPELGKNLEREGYSFNSRSDTEVLLKLYEIKGADTLQNLNGMFAFCIYDSIRESFFLARDRVGIKPLYYAFKDGHFAFASEIKPLLKLNWVSKELNLEAIDTYFTLGYIPQNLCIFKDIEKLRPAHSLVFDIKKQKIMLKQYWQLPEPCEKISKFSENELVEILDEKLRNSVHMRMISDVPIGSFLSGGLDSSIITTLMAQEAENQIKTFNINFESKKYDESRFAQIIARNIGSYHIESCVKIDAVDALLHLITNYDEPFADSSMIPTYYVSKIAREHNITVILSGDGGDELFGGYNWYSWMIRLQKLQQKLGPATRILQFLGKALPSKIPGKHLLSMLAEPVAAQFIERIGFSSKKERSNLLSNEIVSRLGSFHYDSRLEKKFNSYQGDILQKLMRADFDFYLPEDILTKVDRASMAVSLEVRTPWLDHHLVEFAFSLSSQWKIRNGQKKYLPKKLALKILPSELSLNRKHGFNIPQNEWMKQSLGDLLERKLKSRYICNYLQPEYVNEVLNCHRAGHRNHSSILFAVLMFTLWIEHYLSTPPT